MGAALAFDPEAVDYFELPEKRVALNLKVPSSLKEDLRHVMRLWQIMAKARGADTKDIDLTYVANRLLRVGVDGVWGQVGSVAGLDGMPTNDDEWARLERALLKNIEADRSTRSKK